MKFEKTEYYILGRFNSQCGPIVSRKRVSGYISPSYPDIGIRKTTGGYWIADSIIFGYAIYTADTALSRGIKTRESSVKTASELLNSIALPSKRRDAMLQEFQRAPLLDDVQAWTSFEYETLSDHRLDRIEQEARKRGLYYTRLNPADYLRGGSVKIYGGPEQIKALLSYMKERFDEEVPYVSGS